MAASSKEIDLGKILLLRPSRAQSSPSCSMDTSTISSHFSLAWSYLELNLSDQNVNWEEQVAQRRDAFSTSSSPLGSSPRQASSPQILEMLRCPHTPSVTGGIASPVSTLEPSKRPLACRHDLGSDKTPEPSRQDLPCALRKVVDVVDVMAALARLRGAEIIPEGRSAVPGIPSSSGISQAQRTPVDIRKQFWGASAAPRPRSLLLSCQLPDLL